jgi:hypothetical protein
VLDGLADSQLVARLQLRVRLEDVQVILDSLRPYVALQSGSSSGKHDERENERERRSKNNGTVKGETSTGGTLLQSAIYKVSLEKSPPCQSALLENGIDRMTTNWPSAYERELTALTKSGISPQYGALNRSTSPQPSHQTHHCGTAPVDRYQAAGLDASAAELDQPLSAVNHYTPLVQSPTLIAMSPVRGETQLPPLTTAVQTTGTFDDESDSEEMQQLPSPMLYVPPDHHELLEIDVSSSSKPYARRA